MNNTFNWLIKYFKKDLYNKQRKKIWKESAKSFIPEAPSIETEWIKVKQEILKEENKRINKGIFEIIFGYMYKPPYVYAYACLAIIVFTIFIFKTMKMNIYQTNPGEKITVLLPDSSKIRLNSGSYVKYSNRFNHSTREIEFQGEGYFEVQTGRTPFIIHTDIANVKVLGTKFNINNRYRQLEIGVNEGTVALSSTIDNQDSTVILKKGQFSICHAGSYPQKAQYITYKQYPGWLYGKLLFQQSKFNQVCEDIERQFNVTIRITDDRLNDSVISGLFEATQIDSLMSAICVLVQKEYQRENNIITIF